MLALMAVLLPLAAHGVEAADTDDDAINVSGSAPRPALSPPVAAPIAPVIARHPRPVPRADTLFDPPRQDTLFSLPAPDARRVAVARPSDALLPAPEGDPVSLLRQAEGAVAAGRIGLALETLERAETQLLDAAAAVQMLPAGAAVDDIAGARHALEAGDRADAQGRIELAIAAAGAPPRSDPPMPAPVPRGDAYAGTVTSPPTQVQGVPPGHWNWTGYGYVWAPNGSALAPRMAVGTSTGLRWDPATGRYDVPEN